MREMTIVYGLTETSPVSTQTSWDDAPDRRLALSVASIKQRAKIERDAHSMFGGPCPRVKTLEPHRCSVKMPVEEGGRVLLKLGADQACGVPPEIDQVY